MEFKRVDLDGEAVYLNKGKSIFNGWKVVHPIKNEDGSINWKNLICGGNWWNLVFVLVFVLVFLGFSIEYHNNFKECTKVMEKYNFEQNVTFNISNPYIEDMRLVPNKTIDLNKYLNE